MPCEMLNRWKNRTIVKIEKTNTGEKQYHNIDGRYIQ